MSKTPCAPCAKARSAAARHIISGNAKAAVQTIAAGAAAMVGAIDGETLTAKVDQINAEANPERREVKGGVITVTTGG